MPEQEKPKRRSSFEVRSAEVDKALGDPYESKTLSQRLEALQKAALKQNRLSPGEALRLVAQKLEAASKTAKENEDLKTAASFDSTKALYETAVLIFEVDEPLQSTLEPGQVLDILSNPSTPDETSGIAAG